MEYGVGSLVTPSHMAINLRLLKDDVFEKIGGMFFWFIGGDDYMKRLASAGALEAALKAALN